MEFGGEGRGGVTMWILEAPVSPLTMGARVSDSDRGRGKVGLDIIRSPEDGNDSW